MVVWGDDFHYQNSFKIYKNIDRIIHYFNEKYPMIRLKYSTPGTYIKAVNAVKDVEWPVKTDDLFPYADGEHAFWTGYFTSRANSKGFVREASSTF